MNNTTSKPSSLGDVAAAHKKTPGEQSLGVGLEARGIHAWFSGKHVLDNISLDFWSGTVTALIGPSGCGKSTFIRTLNRMHEFIPGAQMAGEVLLDGKDIYEPGTDVTKIRLKVGMVFQKPNPFPSMTIRENVLSGLKLAHIKVDDEDALMEKCLTRAGLWKEVKDRLDASGGSLSGGQQARFQILLLELSGATLLLLDEPTDNLDLASAESLERALDAYEGTVLTVTHDRWFTRGFTRFLVFGDDGQVYESPEPVF